MDEDLFIVCFDVELAWFNDFSYIEGIAHVFEKE